MTISGWILSILGIIILGMLADMLMSETRLQKYVRAIVSIFTVFVIIAPIPSLLRNIPTFGNHIDGGGSININSDFVERQAVRQYETALAMALRNEGFDNVGVSITGNRNGISVEIRQVILNTQNLVMNLENPHININERLRELTAEFLRVSEAIIIVI